MPYRKEKFINGEYYHIYNKTINKFTIFSDDYLANYFLKLAVYYRSSKADIRYSEFKQLPKLIKQNKVNLLFTKDFFKVEIVSYCLMPNHYHFLLKQLKTNGIIEFLSRLTGSFTLFNNRLNHRVGPIFLPRFKSKLINSEESLLHVSRYIHLNPFSSALVAKIEQLQWYPWSSYGHYLGLDDRYKLISKKLIYSMMNNDIDRYRNFVENHSERQRMLELVKHVKKWY